VYTLYGAKDGQIGPEQLNAVRLSEGLPLGYNVKIECIV